MKIKSIKAVEIEGIGIFKCVDGWDSFLKWVRVDKPTDFFITVDVGSNDLLSGMFGSFEDSTCRELNIILASSSISDKLKEKKES